MKGRRHEEHGHQHTPLRNHCIGATGPLGSRRGAGVAYGPSESARGAADRRAFRSDSARPFRSIGTRLPPSGDAQCCAAQGGDDTRSARGARPARRADTAAPARLAPWRWAINGAASGGHRHHLPTAAGNHQPPTSAHRAGPSAAAPTAARCSQRCVAGCAVAAIRQTSPPIARRLPHRRRPPGGPHKHTCKAPSARGRVPSKGASEQSKRCVKC